MQLYIEQLAWGASHDSLDEKPPINDFERSLIDDILDFGLGGSFSWGDLIAYCSSLESEMTLKQKLLIKTCVITYKNMTYTYSQDEELPPPYMSAEYKEKRRKIRQILQSQSL